MFGGQPSAPVIVRRDKGKSRIVRRQGAEHLNGWGIGRAKHGQCRLRAPIAGRNDKAGNPMLHQRRNHPGLQLRVFVRIGEHRCKSVAGQFHLKERRKFGKERVAQVVDHQPDQTGRRRPQRRGRAVVDIADLGHGCAHLVARGILDRRGALQDQADGRLGHACVLRNIQNCGAVFHLLSISLCGSPATWLICGSDIQIEHQNAIEPANRMGHKLSAQRLVLFILSIGFQRVPAVKINDKAVHISTFNLFGALGSSAGEPMRPGQPARQR
mmetsp:Transcript_28831/g.54820  ORF Transcript_28831/g.54820 Transcript_28831/m.54820 type:complete len:270 (+) Transcript_28831:1131-1940(+)